MCHALPPLHTKYISLRRSFIEWILGSAAFSWVTFPPLNLLFLKQTEYVKLWNYSKCKSWKVALFSSPPPLPHLLTLQFSREWVFYNHMVTAKHNTCHTPFVLSIAPAGRSQPSRATRTSFATYWFIPHKRKKITNIQNFHMLPRAFFFSSSKLNTCQKKIWEDAKFANEI